MGWIVAGILFAVGLSIGSILIGLFGVIWPYLLGGTIVYFVWSFLYYKFYGENLRQKREERLFKKIRLEEPILENVSDEELMELIQTYTNEELTESLKRNKEQRRAYEAQHSKNWNS